MKPKLKNAAKNLLLVVLALLLVVLTLFSWMTDLSPSEIPADSFLGSLYQRMRYGANGFELRSSETPAALPVRIAVTGSSGLLGAQYQSASVDALYSALSADMGKALAASGEFSTCTEQDFCAALSGDTLLFGYAGALPLRLLSAWMGGGTPDTTLQTDVLLLSGAGKLYIRSGAGVYYAADTRVQPEDWRDLADRPSAASCAYAGMLEGTSYQRLLADTLIFQPDVQTAANYRRVQPSFTDPDGQDSLTQLLSAFDYDPFVRSYEENGGEVYVDTNNTLHVTPDGTVEFLATTLEGGLTAYENAGTDADRGLVYCADFARSLLETAQSSIGSESQAQLYGVYEDAETTVLTFVQMLGGIPVSTAGSEPFARFEFRENLLVGVTLRLCGYELEEGRTMLLSSAVAAAAAPAGVHGLAEAYTVDEGGLVRAARYFWKPPA